MLGGPFLLPEHVQNLPMFGVNPPAPSTTDRGPRAEVWGLPWQTDIQNGLSRLHSSAARGAGQKYLVTYKGDAHV